MPSARTRRSYVFAAAAIAAFAASGATAKPDGTQQHYFTITLTEGRVANAPGSGGGQIEVESFNWGPRQSTSADGARTLTVDASRTETASGQATGKRQHKPLATRMYYDAPLPQGSIRVKVKMPWLACRVGATYPRLELAGGGKRHVLEGVRVASCGRSTSGEADDRPTEEVAFLYDRIQ